MGNDGQHEFELTKSTSRYFRSWTSFYWWSFWWKLDAVK